MEQQPDSPGISRGQNQLHVLPEDASSAGAIIQPLLDRIDGALAGTQLLVVTSDEESAAAIAARLAFDAAAGIRVLAATDSRRSARVLRASPAHVLVAPAAAIVQLLQASVLKLDGVRVAVLAWIDEQGEAAMAALESALTEIPKDAPRFILVSSVTPAVEQLVERYARRARRVTAADADLPPVSLSYVATSLGGRTSAVRRTLDALDPETAVIVARDPQSRATMETTLRALGYGGDGAAVRMADAPEPDARLVLLVDLPADESALRQLVARSPASRVVAFVTPRQITSLRRMAGGNVAPLVLPEAAARARTREEALRDELRATLAAGQYSRELLTVEPLLSDHDGLEIAAAALRLLEAARARPASPLGATAQGPVTRLYINVGSMDDVRPGDLVGAITNEAGISKAELGRVDVRDKHSTVEVATPVANTVVSKLTGLQMKGRRVLARIDEDRPRERPKRDDA
ncbi:MAG: DbpA RNA binding domain-containing protein, partial [Gemmatimonadaceae bacterium]